MRRLVVLLLLVLSSGSAFAARKGDGDRIARSRHYIVSSAEALTDAQKAAMAGRGIEVTQALSGGRYLVRVASGAAIDSSYEPLTAEKKIHRRALRAAASGRPFVTVNVLFHDDIDFEVAREAIAAAGGSVEDPLQLDFHVPRRIAARIPPSALTALAADERVLIVYGPMRLRPALDNLNTARLSRVDVVQAAPYNLSGDGVVLSFFEFAPADAAHPEFQSRLTTHLTGTSTGDVEHATHVAGTMIAAGIGGILGEQARGMAPRATLHQFSARDDDFLSLKQRITSQYGVVADNNSWGYVLGWCREPSCEGWVWDDTEEYYGAYDVTYTAPLDKITRASGILFVHSAGNDAEKRGPLAAPFAHKHTDDNGDLITGTFCYSQNGSGTDCPAPTCTAGAQFCETVRHPQIIAELPAPYGSIGLMASAKNILAVGAVDSGRAIAEFSSNGPARDGRVKPDVVARGVTVYSTKQGNSYTNKSGTSMAAPAVTGMAALLAEQWRRTNSGRNASPAMLKTLLIAGTEDLGRPGPDYTFGFGLVNVKESVDLVIADSARGRRIKTGALANGATFEAPLTVAGTQNLRVVLGWSDPEVVIFPSDGLAATALVNDLDVRVVTPSGATVLPYVLNRAEPTQNAGRGVNTIDNTEVVEIANAGPGIYRVVVAGSRVTAQSPQEFVVVANGEFEADPAPCVDPNEPNDSDATATALPRATGVSGRVCAAGDVDLFRFDVNAGGIISVTVISTGTPLRVTLRTAAATMETVEMGTNETRTLTAQYDSTSLARFFVRIEAAGAIGSDSGYTVQATYPFEAGGRRRAVRR